MRTVNDDIPASADQPPNLPDLKDLKDALRRMFGFTAFRPYQEEIITSALQGRNVLGILPTGAGKSLTFQLPALLQDRLTLVVSPLVSLMEDQVAQLATKNIHAAACCTARTSRPEWEAILAGVRADTLKILYVAPERLSSPRFPADLAGISIGTLVVDEAHCVSEWGHNFRPDYRRIRDFHATLGRVPVLALTATATPPTRNDIITNLGLDAPVTVVGDFDRANLHWEVVEAAGKRKTPAIASLLRGLNDGSAIVYAPSRKKTEQIAAHLNDEGFSATFYHAGLHGDERERRQRAFQDGSARIMVATVAFGMGVHKDDVRHVIHESMPRSLEAYYQEAGRAGRDGQPARCTLLYSRSDLRYLHQRIEEAYPDRARLREIQVAAIRNELRRLADEQEGSQDTFALALSALRETGYLHGNAIDGYQAGKGGDEGARALRWLERHKRAELNRLYAVRDYGEASGCRSTVLLGYFGQRIDDCEHCDECTGERPKIAGKAARASVSGKVVRSSTESAAVVLDGDAKERFERLREWRLGLAREWNVPAFHIMSDQVLRRVAANPPHDRLSFMVIPGLGEKKWMAFGESLVAVLER